jgi:hypothetical protein
LPPSAVFCGRIGKKPDHPIASVKTSLIQTANVGQSAAISNIKNASAADIRASGAIPNRPGHSTIRTMPEGAALPRWMRDKGTG